MCCCLVRWYVVIVLVVWNIVIIRFYGVLEVYRVSKNIVNVEDRKDVVGEMWMLVMRCIWGGCLGIGI